VSVPFLCLGLCLLSENGFPNQECTRPGEIVTGPGMKRVQEKVWGEILDVLNRVEPGIWTEY
jgi:hypothetical protein